MSPGPTETILHGSAVMLDGAGLLIIGTPGSGKTSLILSLICQHGATLIADDQVIVRRQNEQLLLSAPPRLAGMIEVRELGLVRLPHTEVACPLALIVQLASAETLERLPAQRPGQARGECLLGLSIPQVSLAARAALTSLKALLALRIVTGQLEAVDDIHA